MAEPTQWIWPDDGISADPRRGLPVFAILPNWKGGITERLEWLTDVMLSEYAVEQRRALRRAPRRSFECSFLRTDAQRSRLDTFFVGIGKRQFLVPLYFEQYKLGTPSLDGTVSFKAGDLAKREFRPNDLVMVTNGDPLVYDVLTVVGHAGDTITLASSGATSPWPVGSRIIPLRVARILTAPSLTNPSDRAGQSQVRFELSDADLSFTGDWGHCSPTWRFTADRSEALSSTYERADFTLDFEAGVLEVTDPSERAIVSSSLKVTLFGRDAVHKYRSFLYAARGRATRFYLPSGTSDLQPIGDVAGSVVDMHPIGFREYLTGLQEARKIVAFEVYGLPEPLYRTIIDVVEIRSAGTPSRVIAEQFQFDKSLPVIARKNISRVSFVMPVRLDQDGVEIFHATDNSAAIKSALVVRSSNDAGMPPIACVYPNYTSRPYPLDPSDSMEGSANYLGGQIFKFVIDEAVPSADFLGGTLTYEYHGLIDFETGPDDMTGGADFLGGTLTYEYHGLIDFETGPDDMTGGADFLGGTLVPLEIILYENYLPEDVNVGADFLNGTLTLGV